VDAIQKRIQKKIRTVIESASHECVFGVLTLESEPVDPRL